MRSQQPFMRPGTSQGAFYFRARCIRGARSPLRILLCLAGLLAILGTCGDSPHPFVSGLNQPRGLIFDPSGNLYVAEAGSADGPDAPSADTNHSGRILRITPQGQATPILESLPFTHYPLTGDVGVSDVVWLDGALYALTGEGYDDELSRRVLRILPDGSPQVVGNILNFVLGSMPAQELSMGVGIASNPYAMVAAPDGRALFVSDGASGRILRVTLDGTIRIFAELPHMPPLTGLAFGPDGKLYFAMFSKLPHTPGSGQIWAADSFGALVLVAQELTMPIDLTFDSAGALYILEFGDGGHADRNYVSGGGRLLRIIDGGTPTVVLEGIDFPTAMTFSPSGDLYISRGGAFTPAGGGGIVKVACSALGRPKACVAAPP